MIQDDELHRIRDYVQSVPHRATGGLLLGNRYIRDDVELLVVTRSTTRVPDERLPDETCANHPLFTREDLDRALEKTVDAVFLGRWHSHLDGMSRPSGADLDWARTFLGGSTGDRLPFILHPIVVYNSGDVAFHPFLATPDSGSFQKLPWETATAEEIERIKHDKPAPAARDQEAETGMFSLHKVVGLFREEGVRVASMPRVVHADVRGEGSYAILEVEMSLGEKRAVFHISGDPWYPLNPPAVQVTVDGQPREFKSAVLGDWTSQCNLCDLVKDIADAIIESDHGEALPPPSTTETDPLRREIAMLRAAKYRVYHTPVERAGTLVTVRSALLDAAGKVYYALLPPEYPNGKVAWAIADEARPLGEVAFETIEERPPDFTVLTWFERQVPAAREERAQAVVARERRPTSFLAFFAYLLLFLFAAVVGYLFETRNRPELVALWERVLGQPVTSPAAPASTAPSPAPKGIVLAAGRPVLIVVMDAGHGTNLTTADTQWAAGSALRPIPVQVLQVDLRNTSTDLDRALRAAGKAQAVIVLTYAAADRQTDFVISLVKGASKPVGVISMSRGTLESVLASSGAFYLAVTGSGRTAAQRAIFELKRSGALVTK